MLEWKLFTDEDGTPHLIVAENGVERIATKAECLHAIQLLNEEGNNVVRLSCQNKPCADFGGWIERTREDASKNVYSCDSCGRPMTRG